jgi:hypothetical protein
MEKESKPNMMSLFEYLGYAAGSELGKEVYDTAVKLRETLRTQEVSNPKYSGKVMLYRREFLDEYFNRKIYDAEVEPSTGDRQDHQL